MENGKKALSSKEVAERKQWRCVNGCSIDQGVYPPPRRSSHPPYCPQCHERFVVTWTREKFVLARTRRALDCEAHAVDYREMRSSSPKKNGMSQDEKRNTKSLLRKLNRKNLDMLLSDIRYQKQLLRNERRAAKARDENWQQVFGQ